MKSITIIYVGMFLFFVLAINCYGQTKIYQQIQPKDLFYIENNLFQYEDIEGKIGISMVSNWDEFNENSEDRILIPEKIFVKTSFHIDTEWAGEKIPIAKVYYKTTIQFIFSPIVIGDNLASPISKSEEIPIAIGSFTSNDVEKMFLSQDSNAAIVTQSPVFNLRDYLRKHKIRLCDCANTPKALGRIVLRTYFGANNKDQNTVYENILNVMRNPYHSE